MKAEKRRPGQSQLDIDQNSVLLRAYGEGTDVLIDRERKLLSYPCGLTYPDYHTQEKYKPIRYSQIITLRRLFLLDSTMVSCTSSHLGMYALPKTFESLRCIDLLPKNSDHGMVRFRSRQLAMRRTSKRLVRTA